jgi:hypothetical protein
MIGIYIAILEEAIQAYSSPCASRKGDLPLRDEALCKKAGIHAGLFTYTS